LADFGGAGPPLLRHGGLIGSSNAQAKAIGPDSMVINERQVDDFRETILKKTILRIDNQED
jgi:hypothetical protein